jgi:hypothetical protein
MSCNGAKRLSTVQRKAGSHPVWNEVFEFDLQAETYLRLDVYDQDRWGRGGIGSDSRQDDVWSSSNLSFALTLMAGETMMTILAPATFHSIL